MHPSDFQRRAFTLVELLVVMAVIAILASMVLAALYSAQETARIDKTKSTINKINTLLARHLDEIRTARMPIFMTQAEAADPQSALVYAAKQLSYRWQTQRIELPDRYEDIATNGMQIWAENTTNALRLAYQFEISSKFGMPLPPAGPSLSDIQNAPNGDLGAQNQSAECLYLAVTRGLIADDEMGFFDHESGDEDEDGMPEFHDGWGRPIEFIRWAPGYTPTAATEQGSGVEDAVTDLQHSTYSGGTNPDYPDTTFDPKGVALPSAPATIRQHADYATEPPATQPATWGFKLYPLVVSAGPDGEYGLFFASDFVAGDAPKHNNPYSTYVYSGDNFWRGTPVEEPELEGGGHLDNITNHENLGARR